MYPDDYWAYDPYYGWSGDPDPNGRGFRRFDRDIDFFPFFFPFFPFFPFFFRDRDRDFI